MSDDGTMDTVQAKSLSEKSFSIKFGMSQRKRVFTSSADLKEFITKEEANFLFLNEQTETNIKNITAILNGLYASIFMLLGEVVIAWESEDEDEDELSELIANLEECLTEFYMPLTNTFIGKNIVKLSRSDPILASMVIYTSLAPNNSCSNYTANAMYNLYKQFITFGRNGPSQAMASLYKLEGLTFAANRLLMKWEAFGNKGDLDIYRNSLEQATTELNIVHENSILQSKKIEDWLDNKCKSLNKVQEKIEGKADALFFRAIKKGLKGKVQIQNKVKSDILKAIERLDTAERTYKEKVELNESVGYWESKEKIHRDERVNWLKGLIGLVAATLILPMGVMAITAWATEGFMKEHLILGVLNPLVITATLVSLSLCTFGVKFCSRQFSSAKHLELEATERRTMILTYLALMSENKLKEQEDRKVALDTLFRPSQTGIVAETGNIMPSDSVIKILDTRTNN